MIKPTFAKTLVPVIFLIVSCTSENSQETDEIQYPTFNNKLTPKELAEAYCGSCHLFPEPALLPKSVWEKEVLKNMGNRLGVSQGGYNPYGHLSMYDAMILRNHNIYPKDSLISKEDWKKIETYYLQNAPGEPLPLTERESVTEVIRNFRVRVIDDLPAQPLSTLIKIDTMSNRIYWGSRLNDLLVIDPAGQLTGQYQTVSPPSDIWLKGSKQYVLTMGIMDPSEQSLGTLNNLVAGKQKEVLSGLQRPVHLSVADLNSDQREDFIVSQFGNQTGRLSWYLNESEGRFSEKILSVSPGAIKTEIRDMNQDHRMDVVALFGQGNERISIFYQDRRGNFNETSVLRFPPLYGSSSFQLVDFNKDGAMDILYTNGDNADYSFTLKDYHGVRIYLNNGNNQFTESYFYPMYGSTKSMAADFDLDGDLDIFIIAFFPDFENSSPEGFVYLENQGELKFRPGTFPEAVNGRWLVADAGDVDGDGDEDIVLGSLLFKINAAPQRLRDQWSEHSCHLVILENTLKD